MEKGKSETILFLRKFDRFYDHLHKEGKIKEPTRKSFLEDYIGFAKGSEKNFYTQGIRRVYYRILELLERVYPKK